MIAETVRRFAGEPADVRVHTALRALSCPFGDVLAEVPPCGRVLDYGLTAGVSQGILRAHTEGIVTSTSVLVLGRGFEETAGWLADVGSLEAGIHLAAVG